jgi:hypothetical protein
MVYTNIIDKISDVKSNNLVCKIMQNPPPAGQIFLYIRRNLNHPPKADRLAK